MRLRVVAFLTLSAFIVFSSLIVYLQHLTAQTAALEAKLRNIEHVRHDEMAVLRNSLKDHIESTEAPTAAPTTPPTAAAPSSAPTKAPTVPGVRTCRLQRRPPPALDVQDQRARLLEAYSEAALSKPVAIWPKEPLDPRMCDADYEVMCLA